MADGLEVGAVAFEALSDRLTVTALPVRHAPATLLLHPSIEIIEAGEPGHRHHEVAAAIADQTLDLSFVIAFAGTAETIGKQVWVTPEALAAWQAPRRRTRGGQPRYSDLAIETVLTLGCVFGLHLRQSEGLMLSLLDLMGLGLPVPDHTTLSRRAQRWDPRTAGRATQRMSLCTCWSTAPA